MSSSGISVERSVTPDQTQGNSVNEPQEILKEAIHIEQHLEEATAAIDSSDKEQKEQKKEEASVSSDSIEHVPETVQKVRKLFGIFAPPLEPTLYQVGLINKSIEETFSFFHEHAESMIAKILHSITPEEFASHLASLLVEVLSSEYKDDAEILVGYMIELYDKTLLFRALLNVETLRQVVTYTTEYFKEYAFPAYHSTILDGMSTNGVGSSTSMNTSRYHNNSNSNNINSMYSSMNSINNSGNNHGTHTSNTHRNSSNSLNGTNYNASNSNVNMSNNAYINTMFTDNNVNNNNNTNNNNNNNNNSGSNNNNNNTNNNNISHTNRKLYAHQLNSSLSQSYPHVYNNNNNTYSVSANSAGNVGSAHMVVNNNSSNNFNNVVSVGPIGGTGANLSSNNHVSSGENITIDSNDNIPMVMPRAGRNNGNSIYLPRQNVNSSDENEYRPERRSGALDFMSNAAINNNNNINNSNNISHVNRVFRAADMTRAMNNNNNNNISQPGTTTRDVGENMSLPHESNNNNNNGNNYNYSIEGRTVEGRDALRGFVSRPDGLEITLPNTHSHYARLTPGQVPSQASAMMNRNSTRSLPAQMEINENMSMVQSNKMNRAALQQPSFVSPSQMQSSDGVVFQQQQQQQQRRQLQLQQQQQEEQRLQQPQPQQPQQMYSRSAFPSRPMEIISSSLTREPMTSITNSTNVMPATQLNTRLPINKANHVMSSSNTSHFISSGSIKTSTSTSSPSPNLVQSSGASMTGYGSADQQPLPPSHIQTEEQLEANNMAAANAKMNSAFHHRIHHFQEYEPEHSLQQQQQQQQQHLQHHHHHHHHHLLHLHQHRQASGTISQEQSSIPTIDSTLYDNSSNAQRQEQEIMYSQGMHRSVQETAQFHHGATPSLMKPNVAGHVTSSSHSSSYHDNDTGNEENMTNMNVNKDYLRNMNRRNVNEEAYTFSSKFTMPSRITPQQQQQQENKVLPREYRQEQQQQEQELFELEQQETEKQQENAEGNHGEASQTNECSASFEQVNASGSNRKSPTNLLHRHNHLIHHHHLHHHLHQHHHHLQLHHSLQTSQVKPQVLTEQHVRSQGGEIGKDVMNDYDHATEHTEGNDHFDSVETAQANTSHSALPHQTGNITTEPFSSTPSTSAPYAAKGQGAMLTAASTACLSRVPEQSINTSSVNNSSASTLGVSLVSAMKANVPASAPATAPTPKSLVKIPFHHHHQFFSAATALKTFKEKPSETLEHPHNEKTQSPTTCMNYKTMTQNRNDSPTDVNDPVQQLLVHAGFNAMSVAKVTTLSKSLRELQSVSFKEFHYMMQDSAMPIEVLQEMYYTLNNKEVQQFESKYQTRTFQKAPMSTQVVATHSASLVPSEHVGVNFPNKPLTSKNDGNVEKATMDSDRNNINSNSRKNYTDDFTTPDSNTAGHCTQDNSLDLQNFMRKNSINNVGATCESLENSQSNLSTSANLANSRRTALTNSNSSMSKSSLQVPQPRTKAQQQLMQEQQQQQQQQQQQEPNSQSSDVADASPVDGSYTSSEFNTSRRDMSRTSLRSTPLTHNSYRGHFDNYDDEGFDDRHRRGGRRGMGRGSMGYMRGRAGRGGGYRAINEEVQICKFYNRPEGCHFGDKCRFRHPCNE